MNKLLLVLALAATVVAEPIDLVVVPAGSYQMGSTDYGYEHQVTLTNSYLIGRYEVTNSQYLDALNYAWNHNLVTIEGGWLRAYGKSLLQLEFDGDYEIIAYDAANESFYLNVPSGIGPGWGAGIAYPNGYDPEDHPVSHISWYGAACFCDWQSLMEGLPPFYEGNWNSTPEHNPYDAKGYRLPTEAEWERAARYPDGRDWPWGNSPTANCLRTNARVDYGSYCVGWTCPVGSHPEGASSLGIQDMAGNVIEWTGDYYATYSDADVTNPLGASDGFYRVYRGGAWTATLGQLWLNTWGRDPRSPETHCQTPVYAAASGFRVAISEDGVTADVQDEKTPLDFRMTAFPNPFNPSTCIQVEVPATAYVTLKVYNLRGNEVAVLSNGLVESGLHEFVFDASRLPSGVYIYTLQSEGFSRSNKVLLVR